MNAPASNPSPASAPRRRRPVTRTVLPDARAAVASLAAACDVRDEPHAAEAMERLCDQLAARAARLEACVLAVATADLDTLPTAIALCRRAVGR